MSSPFIGAIYDILKTPFQKGKKDSGNMKTPFIGAHGLTGAMLQVRSDYHRALNKGLGMTRVDPPWMLTAPLTQHQTSSHNWTSPTANWSPLCPTVTQQKQLQHWDRNKKIHWTKLMVSNHPSSAQVMGTFVSMHGWLWVDKNRVERGVYLSMGMENWVKGWGFGALYISSLWVGRQSSLALNILRHMIVTFSGWSPL